MEADVLIAARHQALEGILDERQRRLHAAVEAKVLGHGGVKRVSEATGVARGGSQGAQGSGEYTPQRLGSSARWRAQKTGGS